MGEAPTTSPASCSGSYPQEARARRVGRTEVAPGQDFFLGDDDGLRPARGRFRRGSGRWKRRGGRVHHRGRHRSGTGRGEGSDYDSEGDEKTFLTNIDVPLKRKDGSRRRIYTTPANTPRWWSGTRPTASAGRTSTPCWGTSCARGDAEDHEDEDITVPPCYDTGWRLNPRTEAGYYYLKNARGAVRVGAARPASAAVRARTVARCGWTRSRTRVRL